MFLCSFVHLNFAIIKMEEKIFSLIGGLSMNLNLIGVSYDCFKTSLENTHREETYRRLVAQIELTPISCGICIERA